MNAYIPPTPTCIQNIMRSWKSAATTTTKKTSTTLTVAAAVYDQTIFILHDAGDKFNVPAYTEKKYQQRCPAYIYISIVRNSLNPMCISVLVIYIFHFV